MSVRTQGKRMCVSLYCVCRVRTSFLSVSMESTRIYIYVCVCMLFRVVV